MRIKNIKSFKNIDNPSYVNIKQMLSGKYIVQNKKDNKESGIVLQFYKSL